MGDDSMNGFLPAPQSPLAQVGEVAAAAREQHEIQASIISAKRFPRDESAAYAKIMRSFERPGLAEGATYSFPRGKAKVKGPSVELARELARCWGNVRYGMRVVAVDEQYVQIKGYAVDLESNAYVEAEDKFRRLVQRKNFETGVTTWKEPDERDLRELTNKRGAILIRNCILQIIPPDVTADALKRAESTVHKAARGELKGNKEDVVRSLVLAYDGLGVSPEMLEDRLGHSLTLINEDEVVELRQIFASIRDGNAQRTDYFSFPESSQALAELNAQVRGEPA